MSKEHFTKHQIAASLIAGFGTKIIAAALAIYVAAEAYKFVTNAFAPITTALQAAQ